MREASIRAVGRASNRGVRRSLPWRPRRSIARAIFSSDFSPSPGRSRSNLASSASLRPSTSTMPSRSRSIFKVLGPSPGTRVSSTNPGGYFSSQVLELAYGSRSWNSRIFSAIEFPTPLILTRSALLSPSSSPGCLFDSGQGGLVGAGLERLRRSFIERGQPRHFGQHAQDIGATHGHEASLWPSTLLGSRSSWSRRRPTRGTRTGREPPPMTSWRDRTRRT
jgi:hypothetical protein